MAPHTSSSHNTYPRDVTSPGPDQRPGVARSQRATVPPPETPHPRVPEDGDEPRQAPKPPLAQ